MSGTGRRRSRLLMYKPTRDGLVALTRLFEAGDVALVIDRVSPLEETPEAFRRFGGEGSRVSSWCRRWRQGQRRARGMRIHKTM